MLTELDDFCSDENPVIDFTVHLLQLYTSQDNTDFLETYIFIPRTEEGEPICEKVRHAHCKI